MKTRQDGLVSILVRLKNKGTSRGASRVGKNEQKGKKYTHERRR